MKFWVNIIMMTMLFVFAVKSMAQDSIDHQRISSFVIPAALLSYGIYSHHNPQLQSFDVSLSDWVKGNKDIDVDDYVVYAPISSVYVLNACGFKSKHSVLDFTGRAALSYLINSAIFLTIKSSTNVWRPDGTTNNSFPSGHTSSTFVGAQLLHDEYGHRSAWYSIAGYAVGTSVGYMRMYNNRHWFSDVVAGAGLGILSTKLGGWLYPQIEKILRKNNDER